MKDSELFSIKKPRIRATQKELIRELKAYSESLNGEPIGKRKYDDWKNKRHSSDIFYRSFGSWEEACKKAGVNFVKKDQYTDRELIDHFEKVWRWRKQKLVRDDLLKYNEEFEVTVHPDNYVRRWGGFIDFVKLFSQYMLHQITYDDLIGSKVSDNQRVPISPRLRATVLKRDNKSCVDCGANTKNTPGIKLEIHHIKPVSKGGKTELNNLVVNCKDCNSGKSDEILDD